MPLSLVIVLYERVVGGGCSKMEGKFAGGRSTVEWYKGRDRAAR